jgi:predicted Zn-dependent peptidase
MTTKRFSRVPKNGTDCSAPRGKLNVLSNSRCGQSGLSLFFQHLVRLALLFVPVVLAAQSLVEFEKRITEFTLANGLHFIVLERHAAPVASFHLHVNAGAVNDPKGRTGVAHMFEHMIGKGTPTVGTKNYELERVALAEVETLYDELEAERNKGFRSNANVIERLQAQVKVAIGKANAYVDQNAYPRVIEESGGVGFNAGTGVDYTMFHYSLPANRAELWFLMQSEWLRQVVFREFYKERDVVREERRMRIESSPQGKLQETLIATAFTAHPYQNFIAGWGSDIENLRVTDAKEFFQTYYVPGNITVAIAGDVDPKEMRRLAEKYYGPLTARPAPPQLRTVEPKQEGEKRLEIESPSQPIVLMGYKRPDERHADDPVLDILSSILASGRTGLLYKDLVRDKKISLAAGAVASAPGSKYPNLFMLYSVPTVGHTVEENEKAAYAILDKLAKEPVDAASLDRAKTKLRAAVIRQLDNNPGMAMQLAMYYTAYGNWRKLFTAIDDLNKVTAADVQRVAREYFGKANRTVGYTVTPKPASQGGAK